MMSLLKMHFYLSKKIILLITFLNVGILVTNLIIFEAKLSITIIYFVIFPVSAISYLFENHFIKLVRTMPIPSKLFIKSIFTFCSLLILSIIFPYMIHQFIFYNKQQISHFELLSSLGFIAIGIAYTGAVINQALSKPLKQLKSISISTFFLYFFTLFFSHTLLLFIFNNLLGFKLIGGLIIPITSIVLFFKQYNRTVQNYLQVEF